MPKRTFLGPVESTDGTARIAIPATGGGKKVLVKGEPIELTAAEAKFVDSLPGIIVEGKKRHPSDVRPKTRAEIRRTRERVEDREKTKKEKIKEPEVEEQVEKNIKDRRGGEN